MINNTNDNTTFGFNHKLHILFCVYCDFGSTYEGIVEHYLDEHYMQILLDEPKEGSVLGKIKNGDIDAK